MDNTFRSQADEDRDYEINARYDYIREAYGDPCSCGTLRWGADCPRCYDEDRYEPADAAEILTMPQEPIVTPAPIVALDDDDIPF